MLYLAGKDSGERSHGAQSLGSMWNLSCWRRPDGCYVSTAEHLRCEVCPGLLRVPVTVLCIPSLAGYDSDRDMLQVISYRSTLLLLSDAQLNVILHLRL